MLFVFQERPYMALIGDIKDSKSYNDRTSLQNNLRQTLHTINRLYGDDIAANFTITLGDEFQGLLSRGHHIMQIIEAIRRDMHPVSFRFGLGLGAITTDINKDMAIGADGPGYYMARTAIGQLKQNEQKNKTPASDIRLAADEDNEEATFLINTIFSLMTSLYNKWTDRQKEIIWDIMRYQDGQAQSAKRLLVAQSSVQRALAAGDYYAYQQALDTLAEVFCNIGEEDA